MEAANFFALATKVLGNDLIREIIFNYVLFSANNTKIENTLTACNLRLVSKSWNLSTNKLLRKQRQSIIKLDLIIKHYVIRDKFVRTKPPNLDLLVNCITNPNNIDPDFLPISISFGEEFCSERTRNNLTNFLTNHGGMIVDLDMFTPMRDLPSTVFQNIQNLSFPILKSLSIYIINPNRCDDVTDFLETVLARAHNLHQLKLEGAEYNFPNFRLPTLPSSLKSLEFLFVPTTAHLEVLIASNLKNLKYLHCLAPRSLPVAELHFQFLQTCRDTLESLRVLDSTYEEPTYLRFPVLNALKAIDFLPVNCDFKAGGGLHSVADCLPKLCRLDIEELAGSLLENLDKNSLTFGSMESLKLEYSARDYSYEELNLQKMRLLHRMFPNVQKLDLTVFCITASGFKEMFLEMEQLKELTISFKLRLQNSQDVDEIEASLLGFSLETFQNLKANPKLGPLNYYRNHNEPSIKMLSELKILKINIPGPNRLGGGRLIYSDLLFRFGFLKMPNLRNLYFSGGLEVSQRMEKIWNNRKRTIFCTKL